MQSSRRIKARQTHSRDQKGPGYARVSPTGAEMVLIFHSSPPKISDLAVNLTLTARRSLPQTHAEIEVLLFDVVVSHWGIETSTMVAPGILRKLPISSHISSEQSGDLKDGN
ncbi:hypothetical protein PO909_021896 [Leuciscus waleckii]